MERIENKIYKEIEKHGALRWGELKKKIVPEICSDRPFRETLNRMVENKLILRTEVEKQNIVYSTKKTILEEKTVSFIYDVVLKRLENQLDMFKRKNMKLNSLERANCFLLFVKIIGGIEAFWYIFAQNSILPKNKKLNKKFDEVKDEFYNLFFEKQSKPEEWLNVFADIYANGSMKWDHEIDKILK
jgi:DNA-binding HxlR family transcriptional regulator